MMVGVLLAALPSTAAVAATPPTVTAPANARAGVANAPVRLLGTGFGLGVTVASKSYDMTIASVVRVSSTELRFTVTTHAGAALGRRRIGIRNTDGGTRSCDCINLTFPYVPAASVTKPNIIVINTDDQRWDSVSQLPAVDGRADWARVTNSFVHEPQCCPSRATLFTGQYVWRHGVTTLREGERMATATTIATLLHGAGYQTGLSGKYLNGYPFGGTTAAPAGWDDFRAFYGPNPAAPKDAKGQAVGYPYVNYQNIENSLVRSYAASAADYSTDRYAALTRGFLRRADPNRPVFAYYAPIAPHFTVRPADRDKAACATTSLPIPASFNASDARREPTWMAGVDQVAPAEMLAQRLGTCQTLQAVDHAVASLFDELAASGRLANTYVVFTSDNGYSFGEHRLTGKGHLYDESTRVPLLIRGPGVVPGSLARLTSNVDIAPTLAEIAGVTAPSGFFSGQSFLDDLLGTNTRPNPTQVLFFGCRTTGGPTSFCGGDRDFMGQAWGLRTAAYSYVWYAQTGETQLFDIRTDPGQGTNLTDDPARQVAKADLARRLSAAIAATGTIRGRVTDSVTGAAVPGIVVHLETSGGATVRDVLTDAAGNYAFLPLALVGYRLRFDDPKAKFPWYGGASTRGASPIVSAVTGVKVLDVRLVRS